MRWTRVSIPLLTCIRWVVSSLRYIAKEIHHSRHTAVWVVSETLLDVPLLESAGWTETYKVRKNCSGFQSVKPDALLAMLNALITRQPTNRLTSSSLPSHSFFSSLPISTLNFLDRSNFAAKSREEKISFMKGLTNVLERFTEGLRVRKILPSLLEEVSAFSLLL